MELTKEAAFDFADQVLELTHNEHPTIKFLGLLMSKGLVEFSKDVRKGTPYVELLKYGPGLLGIVKALEPLNTGGKLDDNLSKIRDGINTIRDRVRNNALSEVLKEMEK